MPGKIQYVTREDIDNLDNHQLKSKHKSVKESIIYLLTNGYGEDSREVSMKLEILRYIEMKTGVQEHRLTTISSLIKKVSPRLEHSSSLGDAHKSEREKQDDFLKNMLENVLRRQNDLEEELKKEKLLREELEKELRNIQSDLKKVSDEKRIPQEDKLPGNPFNKELDIVQRKSIKKKKSKSKQG